MKLIIWTLLSIFAFNSSFGQISASFDTVIVWNNPIEVSITAKNWIHNDTDSAVSYLSRRIKNELSPTLESFFVLCSHTFVPSVDSFLQVDLLPGDSCYSSVGFFTWNDSSLEGTVDIEYLNKDTSFVIAYLLKNPYLNTALEKDLSASIRLYPNPSHGKLILTHELTGSLLFQLFELTGKRCFSSQVKESFAEIDISSLPPGVYLTVISNEVGTFRQKLVLR